MTTFSKTQILDESQLNAKFFDQLNALGASTLVKESTIPGAGKGLFAARDFSEGELVTQYGGVLVPPGGSALDNRSYQYAFDAGFLLKAIISRLEAHYNEDALDALIARLGQLPTPAAMALKAINHLKKPDAEAIKQDIARWTGTAKDSRLGFYPHQMGRWANSVRPGQPQQQNIVAAIRYDWSTKGTAPDWDLVYEAARDLAAGEELFINYGDQYFVCATCDSTANLVCGACRQTVYCGQACQAQDFSSHRKKCCK